MLEISAEAAKETTRTAPRTPHSPKATPSKKEADVGPNSYPFHEACGKYHYRGDDRCFKLHPELLRTKLKKNSGEDGKTNNKSTDSKPSTTGSPGIFQLQSGLSGINIYRGMLGLHTSTKSTVVITSPDENPTGGASKELLAALASRELTWDDIINDSGASAHTFNDLKCFPNWLRSPPRWLLHQPTVGIALLDIKELPTLRRYEVMGELPKWTYKWFIAHRHPAI
jgi:hypothetical protein